MSTYLDRILAAHRGAAARDPRDVDELTARAHDLPPTRGFEAALQRDGLGVIAEIKRRSPSKGEL
ncbi:MAG: indole-3-glycerol-phosphate synthase TrpC, partial [Acidimicrobiales bacterium]|nr:indole-3-glycerol-phosphate synthase TrpC [Acidimicrobiales bacterium]